MNPIGGYFELELNRGKEYHPDAIKLNLGRTAFEYILKSKSIQRVFLPYYTCDVMLEPFLRTGTSCEFYQIDQNLEPVFDYSSLLSSDYFVYTNYFGIKDKFIRNLASGIKNLVIDNSQAFFSKPIKGVDTFYSPRKFFGVPDGGYLYTDNALTNILEIDNSSDRFNHLIGRIENCAESSYHKFAENDKQFSNQPIKKMSAITQRLLQNIDYIQISDIRKENFQFLHEHLFSQNMLTIDISHEFVPMIYPFYIKNIGLRKTLIENKIFIATYWPNVFECDAESNLEKDLARFILPLPIDQRYGLEEMEKIVSIIQSHCA